MRIGIDARIFKYENYRGIANSVYEMIKELCSRKDNNQYYLISNCQIHIPNGLPSNWRLVSEGKIKVGAIWNMIELPSIIKKYKLDVFWGPNFLLPPKVAGCKYILTVHDLALFKFKHTASVGTYITLLLFGKSSCKRASRIFTVSESTARDVMNLYGIPKEKITVCYDAIDADKILNCSSQKPEIINLQKEDFFVFLSTIEPRKNPVNVLTAYEKYRNEKIGNEKLLFVGAEGWKTRNIYEIYNNSKYKDDIFFTGYVSNEEKKWLLENALALLFPSLYEGFGIPILEAFILGCPVITSRISAMPEVAGEYAFYVENPLNDDQIKDQMILVKRLTDSLRQSLCKEMFSHALSFSWKRSADIFMDEIVKKDSVG